MLGPRPGGPEQDVSTSCRCTYFKNIITMYYHYVHCQAKDTLLKHAVQLGGKQSGPSWLTFFLRFTLEIVLKINRINGNDSSQSHSGTISEIIFSQSTIHILVFCTKSELRFVPIAILWPTLWESPATIWCCTLFTDTEVEPPPLSGAAPYILIQR